MQVQRFVVDVTTDASGNATAYTPVFTGRVLGIVYIKDGSTPFSNGVDFAITLDATGEGLWTQSDVNASAAVYPRVPTHDQVGGAALYAAGGTAVRDRVAAANDRVKIGVSSGGNALKGQFHVIVG